MRGMPAVCSWKRKLFLPETGGAGGWKSFETVNDTLRTIGPADGVQTALNKRFDLRFALLLLPLWHGALRVLIGYGYAPQRAVFWAVGTVLGFGLFYLWVWNSGGFVPGSDVVLLSDHWAMAVAANPHLPAAAWETSQTGQYYETFAAGTYALDVFIPLVDLGQEEAWNATTATGLGMVAWVMTWFLKAFGWFVTALGAAAVTGIIQRD